MRVIVTGCAGYIGSALVRKLLDYGCFVEGVDVLYYNNGHSLLEVINHPRFTFHCMCASRFFKNQHADIDAVIHLAALVGAPVCDKMPRLASVINTDLTKIIVHSLKGYQKEPLLVFPNTNSGYGVGLPNDELCTEDSPMAPISTYGKSKCAAEKYIVDHYPNHVIFRLATVYGISPRMRFDLMVNDFVRMMRFNGKIEVFEPHLKRNFIHITDVCAAFYDAINKRFKNGVYNIGDDKMNMTKMELAKFIQKTLLMGAVGEMEGKDPDQRDYVVSSAKARSLGFVPKMPMDIAIKDLSNLCRLFTKEQIKGMSNV